MWPSGTLFPMDEHAKLIEDLGGASVLARVLKVDRTTVVGWKVRGIPWRYRNDLAVMASTRGIDTPANFLSAAA